MSSYTFRLGCRPRADFRIPEIIEFLLLAKEAFRCRALYDSSCKPVELTEAVLLRMFEKAAKRLPRDLGAIEDFFTISPRKRDDNTVRIAIHTGTHPNSIGFDSYDMSMDGRVVPDLDYFERFIEIFCPVEAYLAHDANDFRLDAYGRQEGVPLFIKPSIIRGFHYLDEGMARSIGGIDYCLKAPVWRSVRFCEGVLMELVPGPFDDENPKHRRLQEQALEYFDIPLEFSRDDHPHGHRR